MIDFYSNKKALKRLQKIKVGDKIKLPHVCNDGSRFSTCTILGICYDKSEAIYTIKHWNKYSHHYVYKAYDEYDMYLRLESYEN